VNEIDLRTISLLFTYYRPIHCAFENKKACARIHTHTHTLYFTSTAIICRCVSVMWNIRTQKFFFFTFFFFFYSFIYLTYQTTSFFVFFLFFCYSYTVVKPRLSSYIIYSTSKKRTNKRTTI